MASCKPLGKTTLPDNVIKADRKNAKRYDQCGLGRKCIYMGSTYSPRKYYVPYESVSCVFKRVGIAESGGIKGLSAPVLFIVVRYDDGKEYQCNFKYLQEADGMLNQLEAEHPEISLLSPEGQKKKEEKERRRELLENTDLPETVKHEKNVLEFAKHELEKRPALYQNLAAAARMKRTEDLIKPSLRVIAIAVFAIGGAALLLGAVLTRQGIISSGLGVVIMLAGVMCMIMMVNSRALPSPRKNRKRLNKEYEKAVDAMEKSIRHEEEFPIPAVYCHPYTCDRMIRILQERRADTCADALTVLKEDLKAMNSNVVLSGDDYKEVVTIKPLFTVNDYR